MEEASVGRHQLAGSSADNFCDLCNPTLHTRHHFGIWLHGSNYPSRGFSSLHLYWKCVGVSPTTTLTVLNLFLCFHFTEVSGKRHKTWSYVFYFVPDYHTVWLCHKETFQTDKKNIKRKGKSIKSCNVERTPVNILMKLLPRSSTFSGFVWNFQKQTFISLSLHSLGAIQPKVGAKREECSSLSMLQPPPKAFLKGVWVYDFFPRIVPSFSTLIASGFWNILWWRHRIPQTFYVLLQRRLFRTDFSGFFFLWVRVSVWNIKLIGFWSFPVRLGCQVFLQVKTNKYPSSLFLLMSGASLWIYGSWGKRQGALGQTWSRLENLRVKCSGNSYPYHPSSL